MTTLPLVRSGKSLFLLLRLILNKFRYFVLDALGYFGEQDYKSEICYWEYAFWNHVFNGGDLQSKLEYPRAIDEFAELTRDIFDVDKPRVLDLGSGPLSRLRDNTDGLEVYAVDPLAIEYSRLLKKYEIKSDIKLVKGTCEILGQVFRKEWFHIVYASNSLDHTMYPDLCIKQMYSMLKQYGVMYIESWVREGTQAEWKGLHQHNLVPIGDDLYLEEKDGCTKNITKDLSLKRVYFRMKKRQGKKWFSFAWQKLP